MAKNVEIKNDGNGNSWTVTVGKRVLAKGVKYDYAWFRKVYYETFGQ